MRERESARAKQKEREMRERAHACVGCMPCVQAAVTKINRGSHTHASSHPVWSARGGCSHRAICALGNAFVATSANMEAP